MNKLNVFESEGAPVRRALFHTRISYGQRILSYEALRRKGMIKRLTFRSVGVVNRGAGRGGIEAKKQSLIENSIKRRWANRYIFSPSFKATRAGAILSNRYIRFGAEAYDTSEDRAQNTPSLSGYRYRVSARRKRSVRIERHHRRVIHASYHPQPRNGLVHDKAQSDLKRISRKRMKIKQRELREARLQMRGIRQFRVTFKQQLKLLKRLGAVLLAPVKPVLILMLGILGISLILGGGLISIISAFAPTGAIKYADLTNLELYYSAKELDAYEARLKQHKGGAPLVKPQHDPNALGLYFLSKGDLSFGLGSANEDDINALLAAQDQLSDPSRFTDLIDERIRAQYDALADTEKAGKSITDLIGQYHKQLETHNIGGLLPSPYEHSDRDWKARIVKPFGHYLEGSRRKFNDGLTLSLNDDERVIALFDGEVDTVTKLSEGGIELVIRAADGSKLIYNGVAEALIAKGASVKANQIVARGGSTSTYQPIKSFTLELIDGGGFKFNPYFLLHSKAAYSYGACGMSAAGVASVFTKEELQRILDLAFAQEGKPYVFGAAGPDVFDCSGFVYYVYRHSGTYPQIERLTALGFYEAAVKLSFDQAKAGDLVFFSNTYTYGISHIGIYLGNGLMIHAGDPIHVEEVYSPYWAKHFESFGRLPR